MSKRATRHVSFAFLLATALVACASGGGSSTVPQTASVSTGGVTPWPSGSPPFPSSSPTATPSGGATPTPTATPSGGATPTPSGTATPTPTATPANTPTPTPTGSSVPIHIPIPTPTPAPTTPPTLSSSPFFPNGGSGDCTSGLTLTVLPQQVADVSITEPNYTGTWNVQSNSSPSVASASVSGNILTITALTVGTTTVQVADQAGNASPCHVTTQ